jgi:hypothetical protein
MRGTVVAECAPDASRRRVGVALALAVFGLGLLLLMLFLLVRFFLLRFSFRLHIRAIRRRRSIIRHLHRVV